MFVREEIELRDEDHRLLIDGGRVQYLPRSAAHFHSFRIVRVILAHHGKPPSRAFSRPPISALPGERAWKSLRRASLRAEAKGARGQGDIATFTLRIGRSGRDQGAARRTDGSLTRPAGQGARPVRGRPGRAAAAAGATDRKARVRVDPPSNPPARPGPIAHPAPPRFRPAPARRLAAWCRWGRGRPVRATAAAGPGAGRPIAGRSRLLQRIGRSTGGSAPPPDMRTRPTGPQSRMFQGATPSSRAEG